KVLEMV
ncbi:Bcl-2-like protein, partial [Monkeypox virus]